MVTGMGQQGWYVSHTRRARGAGTECTVGGTDTRDECRAHRLPILVSLESIYSTGMTILHRYMRPCGCVRAYRCVLGYTPVPPIADSSLYRLPTSSTGTNTVYMHRDGLTPCGLCTQSVCHSVLERRGGRRYRRRYGGDRGDRSSTYRARTISHAPMVEIRRQTE